MASVSPWPAGIAVSAGGFTRTADMALKSGSNTQVIPCPAVLFILRMRAAETNSSICEVASLDCFGPASAFNPTTTNYGTSLYPRYPVRLRQRFPHGAVFRTTRRILSEIHVARPGADRPDGQSRAVGCGLPFGTTGEALRADNGGNICKTFRTAKPPNVTRLSTRRIVGR